MKKFRDSTIDFTRHVYGWITNDSFRNWYHCLVEWTIGRMTMEAVDETLESACHLVLPD